MQLSGRTALVTGTSRGLGPAIARALADAGARVLCHARRPEDAERTAQAVGGIPLDGDLADQGALQDLARRVAEQTTELHALVHNAGQLTREGLPDVSRADFDRLLAVNVAAPLFLTQALLPQLRAARRARVVMVSSTMGQFAQGMSGGSIAYRISKAALNALALDAAGELGRDGILVNAIHPGWVRTDMGGSSATVEPEAAARHVLELAALPDDGPTGRFFRDGREIPW